MRKGGRIIDGEWRQYHLRFYKNGDFYAHEETAYDTHALKHLNGGYKELPKDEIEKIMDALTKKAISD